jgi:ppGpp synthetase/RelA/SpoT-type nucleotidyltranferase
MKDISEVDQLVNTCLHESRGVKHKIDKIHDYIQSPKESGYRGVHLIYKYQSDKTDLYEDMRIEIQIRTLTQHAWATAVETVGTFIQQSLKSSQGEEDWLQFFKLMASAMAQREGKPCVPNTPEDMNKLKHEIMKLATKLYVEGHLTAFRESIEILADRRINNAQYYLLELDAAVLKIRIKSYKHTQLATA